MLEEYLSKSNNQEVANYGKTNGFTFFQSRCFGDRWYMERFMIDNIRKRVKSENYRFTIHAFERLVERNISPKEIKDAILYGEIIENYPEDKYGPSCLIWGITEKDRILHVQCSINPVWIITSYDPTLKPEEWDKDFKRRKKK